MGDKVGNVLYGKNNVYEMIKNSSGIELTLGYDKNTYPLHLEEIIKIAERENIKINFDPKTKYLKEFSLKNHQGVFLKIKPFRYKCFKEFLENDFKHSSVLILDEVQDPQNLGNIIRNAAAFSLDAIILSENRSVQVTPTVAKIASGNLEYVDIIKVTNIKQAIGKLQENGYWIYGSNLDRESESIFSHDLSGKTAIVLGNEGKGIRPSVLEKCDHSIYIPISENVESLNVSSAALIFMYEKYKRDIGK